MTTPSTCPTCPHGRGFNCRTCWPTWNASQAPEAPDDWWIDDETGEYINATSGERMSAEVARAAIAATTGATK